MEKLKQYKYIILITLMVSGFIFYWYEWRPNKIRNECAKIILESGNQNWSIFQTESLYEFCLRVRGLEK